MSQSSDLLSPDNHDHPCSLPSSSVEEQETQDIQKALQILVALEKLKNIHRPASLPSVVDELLQREPGWFLGTILGDGPGSIIPTLAGFVLFGRFDRAWRFDLRVGCKDIVLGCLRVLDDRIKAIETPPCKCTTQKGCGHNISFFYGVLFECCEQGKVNLKDEELHSAFLAHNTTRLVQLLKEDSTGDRTWSTAALALCTLHERLGSDKFKGTDIKAFHDAVLLGVDDIVKDTISGLCAAGGDDESFVADVFLPLVSCVADPLVRAMGKRYRIWQHAASVLLFHPYTSSPDRSSRQEAIRDVIKSSDRPQYMLTALFKFIDDKFSTHIETQEEGNEKANNAASRLAVKATRFLTRALYADMVSSLNCRFDATEYFPEGVYMDDTSEWYEPWAYPMTYLTGFLRTKSRAGRWYVDRSKLEKAVLYCVRCVCPGDSEGLQMVSAEQIYDGLHVEEFMSVIARLLLMLMYGERKPVITEAGQGLELYLPKLRSTETSGDMVEALRQVIDIVQKSRRVLLPIGRFVMFPSSDKVMLTYCTNFGLDGPLKYNKRAICLQRNDHYWGLGPRGDDASVMVSLAKRLRLRLSR